MDDDLRARFNQLFGDTPGSPAPVPTPPTREALNRQLRVARETELHRLALQDQAVARIRALAETAGIDIEIYVPPSPLRAKKNVPRKRQ